MTEDGNDGGWARLQSEPPNVIQSEAKDPLQWALTQFMRDY